MARTILGTRSATSNATPSGVQNGTPGGRKATGRRPGMALMVGDEHYLWLLVILEILTMVFLRNHFRRYHGG